MADQVKTRFAPSPTGALHLGHAYSALVAAHLGRGYHLRIDDIDHTRCRPEHTERIYDDLTFLGLDWTGEPTFQSDRLAAYEDALQTLREKDLVYACYLTRSELSTVLSAPQEAPRNTDNVLPEDEQLRRAETGMAPAWRLRTEEALSLAGDISWPDLRTVTHRVVDMTEHGDVIIARRDIGTSYHLSVVIDDAIDKVTLVTRGADLEHSTHVHRLLQALLGLPAPAYFHHELVRDAAGDRLAKRSRSQSIAELRTSGLTATNILSLLPTLPDMTQSGRDFDILVN
ncbi:MAG: tRNA glutamyl-Q(34) synthetase GluQRS [Candidatus Puniceispirillaceae bacterium]